MRGKPLLVAVSGGPDSLALFFALHQLRDLIQAPLHVAHVDHGWRATSTAEAAALQNIIVSYEGAYFHSLRSAPPTGKQNREDHARRVRLAFFQQLVEEHQCQAVLLAHHADDQAETVFKRLTDGASLTKLAAMLPQQQLAGLLVWRPLLALPKQELQQWLQQFVVEPVEDPTNGAAHCWRGKMREQLFPLIETTIGRSISHPLVRLSREAAELQDYLDGQVAPLLKQVVVGPLGKWLDANETSGWHRLLLRHLVRRFCEAGELILSRESVEDACRLLERHAANVQLSRGGITLYIDRGRLFLPAPLASLPEQPLPLKEGEWQFGNWSVKVSIATDEVCESGWEKLWTGAVEVVLPRAEYRIGRPQMGSAYPGKQSLRRWYGKSMIPFFLAPRIPVLWYNDRIAYEFLSSKRGGSKNMASTDMIYVRIGQHRDTDHDRINPFVIN